MSAVRSEPFWGQFPARAALEALPFLTRIPRTRLEELFPGVGELEIALRHHAHDRALGHGEAFALSLIAAWLRPSRIFEIGTASGQGTLLMLAQAPTAEVHTLDLGNERPSLGQQRGQPPWQDLSTIGRSYKDSEHRCRVTQHFGDSARFDFTPFRGRMDLVLIDGAHTREYVLSDSRNALEMLAPGGVIVWDDCTYQSPGVARALLRLRREGHPAYRVAGTRLAVLK